MKIIHKVIILFVLIIISAIIVVHPMSLANTHEGSLAESVVGMMIFVLMGVIIAETSRFLIKLFRKKRNH